MSIQPLNPPGPSGVPASAAGAASAPTASAPPPSAGGAAHVAAQAAASANALVSAAPASREAESAQLKEAAKKVQEILQSKSNNLVFSLDKDSGRTVVKVVDAQTEELVRQFPSEEMLALAKSLEEFQDLQQGVLLREKA